MSLTGVIKKPRRGNPGDPQKSLSGYPYRPAQILPHNLDITKEWSIVFYVWDIGKEDLVRKRVLKDKLSAIINKTERIAFAEKMIEEINYFLKRDMHLDTDPAPEVIEFNFRGYTLIEGINYAKNHKVINEGVKKGTEEEYEGTVTVLKAFFKFEGLPEKFRLRDVNQTLLIKFFEYLKSERKNSNKSYNNRRSNLHAALEVLIKKDPKLFHGKNPVAAIPFLKTQSRKHAAYTDAQIRAIIQSCNDAGETHLVFFIQTMFYTLARPNEICELRVGHIKMAMRRILFLAQDAKTGIEDYVGINDRYAEIIEKSGVLKYPENYFLFANVTKYYKSHPDRVEIGKDEFTAMTKKQRVKAGAEMVILHQPGSQRVSGNYFYKRLKKHIDRLGYYATNPNHTLYSFKHTGAISLYMATRDIKLLQRQLRHTTIEQTDTYLRGLGLFEDFEKLNRWEGPA